MNEFLKTEKAILRKKIREKTSRIDLHILGEESRIICELLTGSKLWKDSQHILMFVPMKDEPDISPLHQLALREGKHLYLPRYDPMKEVYGIAEIHNPERDLQVGKYGILEPVTQYTTKENIDMTLVPGLAFDRAGCRLGRGKGFYDRLLIDLPGIKCGICWSWSLQTSLPVEPHDCHVDFLAASPRIHTCVDE